MGETKIPVILLANNNKKTPPTPVPNEDGGTRNDDTVYGPDGATPGEVDRGSGRGRDSTWDGSYDSPGGRGSGGEFLGFAPRGTHGARRFVANGRVLFPGHPKKGPQDYPVFDPRTHVPNPPGNQQGSGVPDPRIIIRGTIRGPLNDSVPPKTTERK